MSDTAKDNFKAYQTTEEPKAVLSAEKIDEMENSYQRSVLKGVITEDEREASTLGQGGYGNVDEHSGIYAYSVPVHVPTPQNDGPVPKISVAYNSRGSNRPGLIAAGWRLELGRIERVPEEGGYMDFENDQGRPGANTHFSLQLNGTSYTLVKVLGKDHVFRIKIENAFIEAERFLHKDKLDPDSGKPVIDYWEVRSADGRLYEFGVKGDAGDTPGEVENKIWHITSIKDAYGQKVDYTYDHYIKPGSPHAGYEKSYSYPSCIKIGMTSQQDFWDTEVRFIYRDDDAAIPNEGYYFLDTEYTGREEAGIVAVIWRRLIAVETYCRDKDGKMKLYRLLEIEASIHGEKEAFWVDSIKETGPKKNEQDKYSGSPPHKFEYRWQDFENPALMNKSTSPLGKIDVIEYDLAHKIDEEAFGVEDIFLVTRLTEKAGEQGSTQKYSYLGGKVYTPFREYRGHRKVIVRDEQTQQTTESQFAQTGVHNGFLLAQYKRDADNNLISSLENSWMAMDYNGGRYLPFISETIERRYAEDGVTVLATVVKSIEKKESVGNPWGYAIDKFGNVLVRNETVYEGDLEVGALKVKTKTDTTYRNMDSGLYYFIGLPVEVKKYGMLSSGKDWKLIEWTETDFNSKGQQIDIITHYDRNKPEKIYREANEYDSRTGKIRKNFRYNGVKKVLIEETRYYDEGKFRFLPSHVINALGQADENLDFDLRLRNPTHTIRRTGMVEYTKYDELGRIKEEIFAGQNRDKGNGNNESVQYIYTITPEERSVETIFLNRGSRVKEFYDQLNRKIKTMETGYKGRWIVKEEIEFDPVSKQPAKIAEPHYSDETAPGYLVVKYDDPRLRKTKEINPNGKIIRIAYDGLKQITMEDVYERNFDGHVKSLLYTSILKEETRDALDRIKTKAEGKTDQTTRYEINYEYDEADRLVKLSDHEGTILKRIDYGDRLDKKSVSKLDISLGKSEIEYDDLGRVKVNKHDFKGSLDRISTFFYDILDRIEKQEELDTIDGALRVIKSDYDTGANGVGQLGQQEILETSSLGGYSKRNHYSYDAFGFPDSIKQEWDVKWDGINVAQTLTVRTDYLYNGKMGGRLERISCSEVDGVKGGTIKYYYDDISNLLDDIHLNDTSIWKVGKTGYTPRDQVREMIFGNGVKTQYGYETDNGQIKQITVRRKSDILQEHCLTYDTADNLKQRSIKAVMPDKNNVNAIATSKGSYLYDDKNQLVTALEDGKKQTFNYHANGSRLSFSDGEANCTYLYKEANGQQIDRITGVHERNISYDNSGNVIEDLNGNNNYTRQLLFNPSNRLSSIIFIDSRQNITQRICYGYGGDDEREAMYDLRNDRLIFYIDNCFEVEWQKGKNKKLIRTHILNEERRIATVEKAAGRPAEHYYFHRDRLSSICLVTDKQSDVVKSILYDPYGNIRKESGLYEPDILFTGQRADVADYEGFRQYDFKTRDYEPQLGIFMSPDKVEDVENTAFGLNRYVYVNNNPLSKWDPYGQEITMAANTPIDRLRHKENLLNAAYARNGRHIANVSFHRTNPNEKWRLRVNKHSYREVRGVRGGRFVNEERPIHLNPVETNLLGLLNRAVSNPKEISITENQFEERVRTDPDYTFMWWTPLAAVPSLLGLTRYANPKSATVVMSQNRLDSPTGRVAWPLNIPSVTGGNTPMTEWLVLSHEVFGHALPYLENREFQEEAIRVENLFRTFHGLVHRAQGLAGNHPPEGKMYPCRWW